MAMKVPMCKLCGKAHWSYEDHAGMEPSVPEYVREMAAGAMGGDVVQHMGRINVTVTKPPNNVTRDETSKLGGRPKKHKDAAARQRAYRERRSG